MTFTGNFSKKTDKQTRAFTMPSPISISMDWIHSLRRIIQSIILMIVLRLPFIFPVRGSHVLRNLTVFILIQKSMGCLLLLIIILTTGWLTESSRLKILHWEFKPGAPTRGHYPGIQLSRGSLLRIIHDG